MTRVIIIGNSGAARECFWLMQDMLRAGMEEARGWRFGGFLSWKRHAGNLASLAEHFLHDADDHDIGPDDGYVIGVGLPALRGEIHAAMRARGARFLTLIHPLADVTPSAAVGEANIFQRNSTVFCDARVGDANYLNGAVNVSHDATVGDHNFFGPFTLILGEARVGSRNQLASRTTILPHARVGDGNIIAPDSVVYKGCRNGRRLAGNPALDIGGV